MKRNEGSGECDRGGGVAGVFGGVVVAAGVGGDAAGGAWFAATVVSLLVGMIVPGFLLNLEDRLRPPGRGGCGE